MRQFLRLVIFCLLVVPKPGLVLAASAQTPAVPEKLAGDLNSDRIVNHKDLKILIEAWGLRSSDHDFDPVMDFNQDGLIDQSDAGMFNEHWSDEQSIEYYLPADTGVKKITPFKIKNLFLENVSQAQVRYVPRLNLNRISLVRMPDVKKINKPVPVQSIVVLLPYAPQVVSAVISPDINQDGTVNIFDVGRISEAWGLKAGDADFDAAADTNHDGKIDIFDIGTISDAWNAPKEPAQPEPDTNHDGQVDIFDVGEVSDAWLSKQGETGFSEAADANKDGKVDIFDIGTISEKWTAKQLPATAEEARNRLIEKKYFTLSKYAQFIEALAFDEVFQRLDIPAIGDLLITKGFIRSDIPDADALFERLRKKGIDPVVWKLRPYGFLSAIGDIRNGGHLYAKTPADWKEELMVTARVKEELEAMFLADRESFVKRLSVKAFLELLGAAPDEVSQSEPIPAITWNDIPTTNPHIVNPALLYYESPFFLPDQSTTLQDHLTGTWRYTPQMIADKLLAMPKGKRAVLIHSRTYMMGKKRPNEPGFAPQLDPLQDAQGRAVVRNPLGVAGGIDGTDAYWYEPFHYFPSLNQWAEVMKRRLDPYLAEIKNRGIPINYVVLDYEDTDSSYFAVRARYHKPADRELLFQDPRMKDFLKNAGLTEAEVRASFANPNGLQEKGGPVHMKWDRYAMDVRAKAIYDGVFSVFEKYFPGVVMSNWSNKTTTDIVPNPDYRSAHWGAGTFIKNATITNDVYGTQGEFRTPERVYNSSIPMPWGLSAIDQTHYYTYFNSMTKMINEANTTSAASAITTQHWVTPPDFLDFYYNGYFGSNMRYDSASGRLVSIDGQDGERIEDAMAELWYRNSFEGKAVNLYNAFYQAFDPSWKPTNDNAFSERTMNEINEMLGFSDRRILNEAWVLVNGKRVSVGSKFYLFDEHPIIWAARANGKNVYRVVLNTDRKILRDFFLKDDGSWSQAVKFQVDNKEIVIPNARIHRPANEVSREGFWVVQNPQGTGLLQDSIDSILSALRT